MNQQLELETGVELFQGLTPKRAHDINDRLWHKPVLVKTLDYPDGIKGDFKGVCLTDEHYQVKPAYAMYQGDVIISMGNGSYIITNITRISHFEVVNNSIK